MKFHTPGTELAAAIHLLPLPTIDDTEPQDSSTAPKPQTPITLPPPTPCPPNIPQNKYKGPHYPPRNAWTAPPPAPEDTPTPPVDPDTLDIKIIGAAPFARILQGGAQAFQLHITPTLPEEHLRAEASPPTQDTEEETLHK
ncbi:hypothetical protein C0992_011887, partial [Termitomyces sp. T32_za158]